jgi:PBP1b-binding outer membrane lipoprotein LpoB
MTRIAALIFTAIVLAGCAPAASTASASPSTATPTSATSTATSAPSATARPSATGVTSDACTLARTDVETVIGPVTSQQSQTTAVPGTTAAMNLTACVFTSNDGFLTFAVTRAPISRTDFDNAVKQVPGVQAESIGDAAYSATVSAAGAGVTTLFVLKGQTYFTLQATSRSKDGTALLTSLRTVGQKVAATL